MTPEMAETVAQQRAAAFGALMQQRLTYAAMGRTRFDAIQAQLWIEDQLARIGESYEKAKNDLDVAVILATEMTLAGVLLEMRGHVQWTEDVLSHGGTDEQKEGEQDGVSTGG